jgi:hypothetical protein
MQREAPAIQQHSFADASQPHEQHALCGQAAPNALKRDTNGFPKVVATRKFRRRRASAGGERIPYGVRTNATNLSKFTIFL